MIDTEKMGKLIQLPLEVMLKNNVAISYFIDYMSAIGGGCQAYIFFYLNVEGWKVMAEQQIQAMELDTILRESGQEIEAGKEMSPEHKRNLQDQMRDAAQSIYEEYLSEKASPQLKIDETAIKRLVFKIRSENPQSEWFDEVQVWSLTQLYSVDFSQSRIGVKKGRFQQTPNQGLRQLLLPVSWDHRA